MTKPVLFDYFRSSASYRVRIALGLKGIDYDRVPIDLLKREQQQPDYRSRNPQGLVPVLELDGQRLTQSLAIIGYLDATRPEPPLLPREPAAAAHVQALALTVACDIHPLNNLRVLRHLTGSLGQEESAKNDWIAHWVREGFDALERLTAAGAGRFLWGDEPTLADICLVPQMFNARRFAVRVDDFPTLVRVDAEANRLAAFADAHPDRVAPAA